MNRTDDELGKWLMAPLRAAPDIDVRHAAEEKARFLAQAESLRQSHRDENAHLDQDNAKVNPGVFQRQRVNPFLRILVAALTVMILLVGSSLTVYAAQGSLPGETLYPIKSWSEDVRLSLTHSPYARLELTIDYTYQRVDEISQLLAEGKDVPAQVSERYQVELENALVFAAQMDDIQMMNALKEIKSHAEGQGLTVTALYPHLTEQNEPAITRIQERLREQVQLSVFGELDPKTFRKEIHDRQNRRQGNHRSSPTDKEADSTPQPSDFEDLPGLNPKHATQDANSGNTDPVEGFQNPGNGNHGQNPSRTQKP